MRSGRARRSASVAGISVALVSCVFSGVLASTSGASSVAKAPTSHATKGGTLKVVGQGDVDHIDTAAGYYDVTYSLDRTFTRQLYTFPSKPKFAQQVIPAADLATGLPKVTNGGKTYTITIRKGADWNTTPARQVTAADVVLGFKRLCNPVAPTGAPGYYTQTIVGMAAYCTAFTKVSPTVSAIAAFIKSHNVSGLKATSATTVQFTLTQPATDFIDILTLPFSSPVPVEYLKYLPDSPQLGQNTISDGPYEITKYVPTKSITLARNPAWKSSSDPIRKAYVNAIQITEGVPTNTNALQDVQTGTDDLLWDQNVPTASLAGMEKSNDPNLVIGPDGDNYIVINPYLVINLQSPNNGGALKKLKVRQALEYAINKVADSQVYGGSSISNPLNQIVPGGSVGNIKNYNPYPTKNNEGDPAKSKALLKAAGYKPGQIVLNLVYRNNTVHPAIAQTDEAALQAGGFGIKLIETEPDTFYSKYLENPTASKAGSWDIAEAGWIPDWFGNNGRAVIEPLLDGRGYGPDSSDFGDYNSPAMNKEIDAALSAKSTSAATKDWQAAAKQVMSDAAVVPEGAQKVAVYKSSAVQNCVFNFFTQNCDYTSVWLKS